MSRLQVVATPIGNLEDLTARARSALKAAKVVYAEDTRRSRGLLQHIGSAAELRSCHQHNELSRSPEIVRLLEDDEAVCLVTDAGAPGLSDPGGRLIASLVEAGCEVEVLPGASALVAALMGAGVPAAHFSFVGFLPRRRGARRQAVAALPAEHALVAFEAADRVPALLEDLFTALGPRPVVVARELTKLHETFHRGTLGQPLAPDYVEKGEVVVVVGGGEAAQQDDPDRAEALARALKADPALKPKARAKALAAESGLSNSEAYALLESLDDAEPTPAMRNKLVVTRTKAARARLMDALADAVDALLEADGMGELAPPELSSGIPSADRLMQLLARERHELPAPVEVKETATALLGAISAADALDDALAYITGEVSETPLI